MDPMTRPRARPKPGRYWVVEDDEPFVWSAFDNREHAALDAARLGAHVVECVPMPRVRVGTIYGPNGLDYFVVLINGARTGEAYRQRSVATNLARDLRRALRGK